METGKYLLFEEKRKQASKEVKIQFINSEDFSVVDEGGNLKYCGKIIQKEPHKDDYCTCQSFYHSNTEIYQNEHGFSFQCKHILAAKEFRFTNYPVSVTNDCVVPLHLSLTHEVAP